MKRIEPRRVPYILSFCLSFILAAGGGVCSAITIGNKTYIFGFLFAAFAATAVFFGVKNVIAFIRSKDIDEKHD